MYHKLKVLATAVHKKNLVKSFLLLLAGSLLLCTFNVNAQSVPCNSSTLTNSNGYYGGFEAGGINGINNFSNGAASTQYGYGDNQGEYQILSNTLGQGGYLPLLPHSGNFFLTSHTSASNLTQKLWFKTLTVYPGQKLQVCAWISNLKLNPVGGFPVTIVINTASGATTIATETAVNVVWTQFCGTYTVPAGITSLDVEIEDPAPTFGNSSHFLALDDICITDVTPVNSINPDFNSTFVNVAVPGSVSTNDNVAAGTVYGTTPVLVSSPSGSVASITMSSNGTYSFTANTAGVYTYNVSVCVPGQPTPCPISKLVITVLNANIATNGPVANVDIATTKFNTPVILKTLTNDAAGNLGNTLVPSTVMVTVAPLNGTTSVNSATGDITYTPNAGFTGSDTFRYQVCDNQSVPKCATALQIITIKNSGAINNTTTAADDYRITPVNTQATGNVKTNDTDAEGNTQTVTAQTVTVAGKGTVVFSADGTYIFTPVTGFTGPIDFIYTTCDNGTPQACALATLHILVVARVAGGPLPITLSNFTAVKQNKVVALNWQTSSEQNSSHFEVEFSREGNKFDNIGRVTAAGNSNLEKRYSSVHLSPVNGINYYRLKLVDADGTFKYSDVRTVKFSNSTSITIMPNPTTDRVFITSNDGGMLQSVGLYDVNGKFLKQINNFALGNSIDLSVYAPSIYILKLIDKQGNTEVIKVVRQ